MESQYEIYHAVQREAAGEVTREQDGSGDNEEKGAGRIEDVSNVSKSRRGGKESLNSVRTGWNVRLRIY